MKSNFLLAPQNLHSASAAERTSEAPGLLGITTHLTEAVIRVMHCTIADTEPSVCQHVPMHYEGIAWISAPHLQAV